MMQPEGPSTPPLGVVLETLALGERYRDQYWRRRDPIHEDRLLWHAHMFRHLLPEIRDLFDGAAAGSDVVVGSRFSRHSILLNYPFQKIFANRAFHLLARAALRRPVRDLTNNLKLSRREVVDRLELTQPGFAVNIGGTPVSGASRFALPSELSLNRPG